MQGSKPPNPFVQALAMVVGIILFIGAAVLGGIVLAALVGFLLVAGLIIYVRVWWVMRKAGLQRRGDSFVEAEDHVVVTSDPDDDPH